MIVSELVEGGLYRHNKDIYVCRLYKHDEPSVVGLYRFSIVRGQLVKPMVAGMLLSYHLSRHYVGCWYAVKLKPNGASAVWGGPILDFEERLRDFVYVAASIRHFVRGEPYARG